MNLSIVPILDPMLVPRDLLEQIKPLLFDIDDWYRSLTLARQEGDDSNLLFGFIDKEHKIHGVMWATLDVLHRTIFINFLTLGKRYQGHGNVFDRDWETGG